MAGSFMGGQRPWGSLMPCEVGILFWPLSICKVFVSLIYLILKLLFCVIENVIGSNNKVFYAFVSCSWSWFTGSFHWCCCFLAAKQKCLHELRICSKCLWCTLVHLYEFAEWKNIFKWLNVKNVEDYLSIFKYSKIFFMNSVIFTYT